MAEKRERVAFCLHRVNLEGAEKLYPAELSGGMIKRVAIARAIVMNPRYLFCDEPNSGLDPVTSNVIDRLIYDITKEYGITTIINTHDMNSVMEIGEKIVFINQGRKGWEGTSADILHTDNRALNDFVFASNMAKKGEGGGPAAGLRHPERFRKLNCAYVCMRIDLQAKRFLPLHHRRGTGIKNYTEP